MEWKDETDCKVKAEPKIHSKGVTSPAHALSALHRCANRCWQTTTMRRRQIANCSRACVLCARTPYTQGGSIACVGVHGHRLLFSIVSVSRPPSALRMILLRHPDLTILSTTLRHGGSNMHGYFRFTYGYCKPHQLHAMDALATRR